MNTNHPPRVRLIGAPTDVGASERGAGMGPDALRVANLGEALQRQGAVVEDIGNLAGPQLPRDPPDRGYRNLAAVAEWCRAVHDAVLAALEDGCLPGMLGGDHALGAGSVAAVAQYCRAHGRRLKVLWLDAHADCNTPQSSPSGNIHGMPVACLRGVGPEELIHLAGHTPAIEPGEINHIGVRSVDDRERDLIRTLGLRVFDMRSIDEMGMRSVLAAALADVDAGTHLHVSFDVDFLDPSIAPGVATTVPGGPTYREAQLCMEMIADTGRLGSFDIVELNPAWDTRNRTAQVAVELVESLFGKSTLARDEQQAPHAATP